MTDRSRPIRFTRHAEEVMRERDISTAWIERALLSPTSDEEDLNDRNLRRAFAPVPERDGRMLRVVYAEDRDGLRVITAFLDRGRSR